MMGTTMGFQNLIMEAIGSVIIILNPATDPTVSYEYLFCHLTSNQLRPPA
jgi:hypothetical protein